MLLSKFCSGRKFSPIEAFVVVSVVRCFEVLRSADGLGGVHFFAVPLSSLAKLLRTLSTSHL